MQSRKKQNMELEMKIRKQKKLQNIMLLAIVAVMAAAIAWMVWDAQSRRFVLRVNGERIETTDLRMLSVLSELPINDSTIDILMEDLKRYVILMQMARENGIKMTDDERSANEFQAQLMAGFIEEANPGALYFANERRMGEFVGAISTLWPALVNKLVVPTYVVEDEEEFEDELRLHMEQLVADGTETWVKFLARDSLEDIMAPAMELTGGENFEFDFDAIAAEYCVLGTGLEPMLFTDFQSAYGVWDIIGIHPSELEVGQHSQTLTGSEYFFILYIDGRNPPELDDAAVREEFRENFIMRKSEEIFWEMLQAEMDSANVTINRRAYDSLFARQ